MRHVLLVVSLSLFAVAAVFAAPWSRYTSGTSSRGRSETHPWVEERELPPYSIRSEFPLRDVHDLVQELGDLQRDLEQLLQLRCHPRSVEIHLFASKRSYDRYLRSRIPEGVNRQALFIPGDDADRVYAFRHKDLDTDVRHETTHALLNSALRYVPIWIDEGLAEYFEVPATHREKGHSHRKELQQAIRHAHWKPNLEQLEANQKLMDMDRNDYRDAWGIVHFLLHGPPEARQALDLYFAEIQSGVAATPISVHLRRRIPNLDQAIISHLTK